MAVVKGKVSWCHVQQPDQYDKYSVCVGIPKELAKEFTDKGVGGIRFEKGTKKPQKDEDGNIVWQFKTNAIDKEGNKKKPIPVVDARKNPFKDLIGNGSVCKVQYNINDWKFGGKTGTSAYLNAVQVLELVPYGGGGDEFEEEDGFDAAGPSKPPVDEFDDDNLFD